MNDILGEALRDAIGCTVLIVIPCILIAVIVISMTWPPTVTPGEVDSPPIQAEALDKSCQQEVGYELTFNGCNPVVCWRDESWDFRHATRVVSLDGVTVTLTYDGDALCARPPRRDVSPFVFFDRKDE